MCGSPHENFGDEFVLSFPVEFYLSGSSYLDGLWDER